MIKASQEALVHQAKRDLIIIQRKELQYFSEISGRFGLQGALFAGFLLDVFCNVNTIDSDGNLIWKWIYWLSFPIVITFSLAVTLGSTFSKVFAPGLALRGPSGSMIRALEGLVLETNGIFVLFFWMIVLFQIFSLSLSFVIMSENCAIVCSIIFAFGVYLWYYQCLRIFNRFKVLFIFVFLISLF